jgi:hypothetical protein
MAQWVRWLDYLTTHTSLSPIRRGFAPGFVNYKIGCTRLVAASDKVYQLLGHGRWFSPGTPASSTTNTSRHDIAEILLKVALNTKNQPTNQPHRIFLSHVYNHVRNKNMMHIVLELRIIIYQWHISANKPYKFICNFQRCITNDR